MTAVRFHLVRHGEAAPKDARGDGARPLTPAGRERFAALVGHNPEVAEAVSAAAGRQVEVRPGTVAAIDVEGGAFRLAWLEAP